MNERKGYWPEYRPHEILSTARRLVQTYDGLEFGAPIDELAFLAPDPWQLAQVVERLVAEFGFEQFNTAMDTVSTSPIPSNYTVHYDFLRHPELSVRLEMMSIVGGASPLHDPIRRGQAHGTVCPVHASFKLLDRDMLHASQIAIEATGHYLHTMKCESRYGEFHYYLPRVVPFGNPYLYLKPRINTRDER